MYYKDNIDSLIHTIPTIPKIITFFIILLFIIIIYLLKIKIYDYTDLYAIKYSDTDYLDVIINYDETESIFKGECIQYNKNNYKIGELLLLKPEKEQIYNQAYNNVAIKLDNYNDIPENLIIKIRLLSNKQSIFKKIIQ